MNDKLPSNKHDNNNGYKARGTSCHKWLGGWRGAQGDIWLSLAKYVSAISSPIGGMAALGLEDHNLNGASYRDGWGRQDNVYNQNWLHSDMKDMAFFYVYPLYNELVQKGMMK